MSTADDQPMSLIRGLPRRVALTVDVEHPDRPGARPDGTERLLDLLDREGVRATFFVQGRWAEAYPTTARRLTAEGHVVGNHSFFHASLPLLSDEGLEEDIRRADQAIRTAAGVDPHPWFRCPFGDGLDDPRVLGALERLGYVHVGWDVDASDWEPGRTAESVAAAILDGASGRATAIVLIHGWPAATVEAVASAIAGLRGRGATFVTVDELAAGERTTGFPPVGSAEAVPMAGPAVPPLEPGVRP